MAIIVAGLDAAPAALPPAKTKKSVRIESPTGVIPPHPAFHSVDNFFTERVSTAQYASVRTFASSAGIPNSADDSSAASDIGRRDDFDIRGYISPGRRATDTPEVARSPGGVPANPFSKTLATLEPQERGSGEPAGQSRGTLRSNNCLQAGRIRKGTGKLSKRKCRYHLDHR